MKHLLWLLTLLATLPAAAQLQQIQRFEPTLQVKSPIITTPSFAEASALSGSVLALGYPRSEIAGKAEAGLVLLVNADTGKLIRIIRESTPDTEALFGARLAISGNLLAVGAPGYQGGRGAAFVFNLTTGQQLRRIINNENAPNGFGSAVAIAGDRLIVGMPDTNGPGDPDQAGQVVIYSIATGQNLPWLSGSPGEVGDRFGASLAIQGRQLAVGAPGATSNGQVGAGAVYVFDLETGTRQARLQASDPTMNHRFGVFLAFARQHLAITARGALYVNNTRTFSQTQRIAAPSGEGFGPIACHGLTGFVTFRKTEFEWFLHTYDLTTGTLLEAWSPSPLMWAFGFPLSVDSQRIIAGTFAEVIAPGTFGKGGIYSRRPPIAIDSLQSLSILKPQLTISQGTFAGVAQISIRPNGNVGILNRFKSPSSSIKNPAVIGIDGIPGFNAPFGLITTGSSVAQLGGAGPLSITALSEFRVNHSTQLLFLGRARSPSAAFPGSGPFIGLLDPPAWESAFVLRRAGNDAAGPGSGKIADFLDLAQSRGLGFDADLATSVRLQPGVDGVTPSSDSAVLLISTNPALPQTTLAGAKEGTQDPSSAGITFGQINPQVTFATGLACFTAFRQTLSDDKQATYTIDRAGNTQRFVTRGDVSGAGTVQTLLGISADGNDQRLVRFTTTGSGVNASNNEMLVTDYGFFLRKGAAYHAGPAGVVWSRFLGIHPARAGNLIIHGRLKGPKVTAANDGVVTLFESGNPPLTLMREGDLVHGYGGARIGSILRVDAQPGDPSGSYLILATLTGVPADSNLALFSGRSSFGNNVILTPKLPVLMLRKGQWTRRPAGYSGKLTGIQLPGKSNVNTAGFGGTGHLHWQGGDGKAVMQLDWNTHESELVRASW